MKPTHIVLKKLPGPNGDIKPGTEVDASEWRNAPLLVEQRYLKPLDGVEASIDLPAEAEIDLRARVTEIVLEDLREDGPIAHALRMLSPADAISSKRRKSASI